MTATRCAGYQLGQEQRQEPIVDTEAVAVTPWASSPPAGQPEATEPTEPSEPPQPPKRHRVRNAVAAGVIGVLALGGAGAVGAVAHTNTRTVIHNHTRTVTETVTPAACAQVVDAYNKMNDAVNTDANALSAYFGTLKANIVNAENGDMLAYINGETAAITTLNGDLAGVPEELNAARGEFATASVECQ